MESVIPYRSQISRNVVVLAGETPSLFAWDPTKPTISQTREAAINSIRDNFSALNSGTAALPYLPLAGGVTMAGLFALFGNAATAMQPVPLQQLQSYVAANNGVATFNTRTGAVTLTSADVTGALTFTPANAAGQAFSGNISAPRADAKEFRQTQYAATTGGAIAIDEANGQSQIITLNAASTIASISNNFTGTILRLTFVLGAFNVTAWPATVKWVGGVAPDLTAGTLKRAIVVLMSDGANHLANSAVY
jgi:hypothetical protein